MSCGTTGHIEFYDFNKSKYDVQSDLMGIINKDSAFSVPLKWSESTKGGVFETYYVYFKQSPNEMYEIGFIGDSSNWRNASSTLALIALYNGDRFLFERVLSSKEQRRMEKRFEDSILSKLSYSYKKSD